MATQGWFKQYSIDNIMKISLNKSYWLAYTLVLLYAIDPFGFGFVFGYLLTFFLILQGTAIIRLYDKNAVFLLIFCIVYAAFYAFDPIQGIQYIFIYLLVPVTFYLTGKLLYEKNKSEHYNTLLLLSLGIIFSLTSMTSIFKAILENGFVTLDRDVPVIWTGNIIPATNMAASFVINMCIPGILILGYKNFKSNGAKILLITIYILSLLCVMRLGSRTHLAITLFAIGLSILYKFKKQSVKKNFVLFLALFALINLASSYLSISSDSDLFSAYADRMDSKTHGVSTAGGRLNKWEKSIEYLFKKPLGWDLDEFGYAHNLWFDTSRVGGVLALILLLVFTIKSLEEILRLFKAREQIYLMDGQLLIYCICFLLVFFVEPILEGYFIVFSIFCIIMGFLKSHNEKISRQLKNHRNDSL